MAWPGHSAQSACLTRVLSTIPQQEGRAEQYLSPISETFRRKSVLQNISLLSLSNLSHTKNTVNKFQKVTTLLCGDSTEFNETNTVLPQPVLINFR